MDYYECYSSGKPLKDVSALTGISMSTLRRRFIKAGIMRGKKDAAALCVSSGRAGSGNRGKKIVFTKEWKENISKSKLGKGVGRCLKPSGYYEITIGENKGRGEHIVIAEKKIGRRLFSFECVHHIDFNKTNNNPENLLVISKKDHARLHANKRVSEGINYDISKHSRKGEEHHNSKLKEHEVIDIENSDQSALFLAKKYDVSKSCIRHIKKKRNWTCIINK